MHLKEVIFCSFDNGKGNVRFNFNLNLFVADLRNSFLPNPYQPPLAGVPAPRVPCGPGDPRVREQIGSDGEPYKNALNLVSKHQDLGSRRHAKNADARVVLISSSFDCWADVRVFWGGDRREEERGGEHIVCWEVGG